MAATSYASVVSLMQTIDHVVEHGRNSFALGYEQIQSVYQKAEFLVDFLESYSGGDSKEVEALELQISDAAHAVEDLTENKVVDYIRDNQSISFDKKMSDPFCLQLQGMIEGMDLLKKEAMKIKEKNEVKVRVPKDSVPSSISSRSLPAGKDKMEGFDDVSKHIMERLTLRQSNRLIIPISGMGGLGKTTLAKYVYENPYIVKYFDVRAWVTISQDYEIKEILSSLLIEFNETTEGMDESKLGLEVHKHLFGRRYLIVMDDMWSIDVWEKFQHFFPENGNGSGILITTRLTNMATHLGSGAVKLDFLDDDQSWNLFREKVFGQRECPLELEEIGKKIAKNCKGLPLSIVVIAGLLAKSNMTQEYWHGVAEKVTSIVSKADDGQCSKILSLSYVNLPIHLKPCFLYMGVFPEDHEIEVSKLINLWVAEGFLKANRTKSLEEVAEGYLKDLVDRNIVMVHMRGKLGNLEYCKIHDLIRDLCIREAEKEKFFCVAKSHESSEALHNQRRVVIDKIETKRNVLIASPLLRSITCNTDLDLSFLGDSRLIRVLNGKSIGSLENIVNLVNLRYLNYWKYYDFPFSSMSNLLWNIQSLTLCVGPINEPVEIWKMKQLRYLWSDSIAMIDPGKEDSNMKHLHTLNTVHDLTFSEGVVKMISNIEKLSLAYRKLDNQKNHCLNNLQHLHKLEYLYIQLDSYQRADLSRKIVLPLLLKELKLSRTCIPWEDMTIIGCLPYLQVLTLQMDAFIGEEWNPIEGQFISLKYLKIERCNDLKVWNAESIHFPVLEKLILWSMSSLEELPLGIGEIPTLQCIELKWCSDSALSSVINILDEQENQGNDEIQVKVKHKKKELQNLEARRNLEYLQCSNPLELRVEYMEMNIPCTQSVQTGVDWKLTETQPAIFIIYGSFFAVHILMREQVWKKRQRERVSFVNNCKIR